MTGVLEWLLGLEQIRLADAGPLLVRFATPPLPWIMLACAVLLATVAWTIYRRQTAARRWRWPLMTLRLVVLMIVLFILGRPMLVLRRNLVDPSFVAVLLDRSGSMATRDPINNAATGNDSASRPDAALRESARWDAARAALTHRQSGILARLTTRHRVGVWLFDATAQRLGTLASRDDLPGLVKRLEQAEPAGRGTDISGAIAQVLEETQGARLAGLIVLGDGRQTGPALFDPAVAQAQARSSPVHTIAAGSTAPRRDIAVEGIRSEENVFLHDYVALHVRLSAAGYDKPVPVNLELRDPATGEVLATRMQAIGGDMPHTSVELSFRPRRAGRRVLKVTALPRRDEANRENNVAETVIQAHDAKIRVLYVEGEPRYEYRYLKNLIVLEPTIESSCLLLGATPGFAPEGTRPIRRFPDSIEELRHYDVVILGDVDPHADWITPAQMSLLTDFVSVYGGGIAFVAGERSMPHRLRRTILEKLLPVRIDPQFYGRYDAPLTEPFVLRLTPAGRRSPVFRLERDVEDSQSLLDTLAGWYWFARVLGPQPAATVLAVHPTAQTPDGPVPLAVMGRFGAGRTFYLGSDDLWRWREYSGDTYYQGVWLQVMRMLARSRRWEEDRSWHVETDRRQYDLGDRVRLRLSAPDPTTPAGSDRITLRVTDMHGGLVDRVSLERIGPQAGTWEGWFIPKRADNFLIALDAADVMPGAKAEARSIIVRAADPETKRIEADHELLRVLAERTGGRFARLTDNLDDVIAGIPDRSVLVASDVEEPLWDTPLVLMLFVGLITAEWIGRKALGLV